MSLRSAENAPPAAQLILDVVNSVEWQTDEEWWTSPADLRAWMTRRGFSAPRITHADVRLVRRIREGLREVLLAHAGHEPLPEALADLDAAFAEIPVRLSFDGDGRAGLVTGSAGAPFLAGIVAAIDRLRSGGDWDRLKACSRDTCRWAYWDSSRNRSGRWCSMEGCGNYVKMRRRNGSSASADAIPGTEEGSRAPRMLDVAARAGCSIKTVSNVVTGAVPVAPSTRARVEAAIAELGYRPNLAARELRTGRREAEPPGRATD